MLDLWRVMLGIRDRRNGPGFDGESISGDGIIVRFILLGILPFGGLPPWPSQFTLSSRGSVFFAGNEVTRTTAIVCPRDT
jgi:hypothetical protein